MNPAEFSIKNRLISMIVIMAALIGGWMAYKNMPRFEDPEFVIRTAVVITQYPGATPQEVADEVTEPLETAIQQMQEVKKVTSTSSDGLSQITVDIKTKFAPTKPDLEAVWSTLRARVDGAQIRMPPGAQPSMVNDGFGDVFGIYYLITGDGFTPKELHDYAKSLRTELLSVDGVGKIAIGGTQPEAIYVEISRERAAALGASVDQVYNDLAKQNSVTPAGNVKVGNRRLIIQPTGTIDSVEAIKNLIVSTGNSGTVVYLKDIATVRRDYQDPIASEIRYDGKPAISLAIANVTGANVVKMGEGITAKLKATESQRPYGIVLNEFYHQGKIVAIAVNDFVVNVMLALLIVLITLMIFMGWRSAVVIGGVLLVTIAATLATMYMMNIPMHRISLGALIVALGMLVDNAIVVTEGILIGTQNGEKKLAVAKKIVKRTMWPLLGGTLVGIFAFAPIGLSPGSMSEYAGHLFWVIMISLAYSWIFAITAVPLFADLLFKEGRGELGTVKADGKIMSAYKSFMRGVLKARWAVIGAVIVLFALSIVGFGKVRPAFFPASTSPQIVVDYWLPAGTDISVTKADMLKIEAELSARDDIEGLQTLIGQGGARYMLVYASEPQNSSYGQFLVKVKDYNEINTMIPQIQTYIDKNYPDAQSKVWRFSLGPGGGSKIEAEFSGADPVVLRRLANEAKAIYAADGKAISIKDDWRQQVSVIQPLYNEVRGRRLGISREDISNAIQTNFSGRSVGVYREGDTLIPIIARAPARERGDANSMADIQIISQASGKTVPLVQVVDGFQTTWRNGRLKKVNRVLTITAQSDAMSGETSGDFFARVKPQIEAMDIPDGYNLEWSGEYGDSQEANEGLASTLPLGLLAMVLVVVILFNGFKQPIIIWLVVPLALIGVVFGLLVTDTGLEFMAIIGLLALSGLLIKNGIVLVDQMDLEIKEGKPRFDAVVDSAASRVRPVMMGSLTTVLGLIPLFGDAFFKAMAVVLVFGLSFATILTLVVVPALYVVFFRIKTSETAA
ncbi:MAG: multidrug transporter AcrB [Robiginitomaculum sp.]|nr:MAG: multidrug transporter AcrB [Robiginitomaculum sp.]